MADSKIRKGLTMKDIVLKIEDTLIKYKTGNHYRCNYNLNHKRLESITGAHSSVTKTDYGYNILKTTTYITVTKTKLFIYNDGFAKAVSKVRCNYSPPYQITKYYDGYGNEIIGDSTRSELNVWKKLRRLT